MTSAAGGRKERGSHCAFLTVAGENGEAHTQPGAAVKNGRKFVYMPDDRGGEKTGEAIAPFRLLRGKNGKAIAPFSTATGKNGGVHTRPEMAGTSRGNLALPGGIGMVKTATVRADTGRRRRGDPWSGVKPFFGKKGPLLSYPMLQKERGCFRPEVSPLLFFVFQLILSQ